MRSHAASQRTFIAACVLLFMVCAVVTAIWARSMDAMNGTGVMDMAGGWRLSMAWMRMPGQTWAGVASRFIGMWMVMMTAMMLPSLIPMLWRYRRAIGHCHLIEPARLHSLTATVAAGYFCVWVISGTALFALGAPLAAAEISMPALSRAVPVAAGVVTMIAGAWQLSAWKSHHLRCCRTAPRRRQLLPATTACAWRHGLDLGLHCCLCCAPLTAAWLAAGLMDLRVMIVVTAAITLERWLPSGQ